MTDTTLPPVLTVDGTRYRGWTAVRVRQALDEIAGSFEVVLSDRWDLDVLPRIRAGAPCTLDLAGQTVITGYIDRAARSVSARERDLSISGRDATADLVDASALPREPYQEADLLAIASDQCGPFKITVRAGADVGAPFRRVVVEPGESVFELLERLARQRGLLLMPDAGGLLIGQPDGARASTALVLGQNLLRYAQVSDWRERYSEYRVRGQSSTDDDWYGEQATAIKARATDADIDRHRPLVVSAEDNETDLQARADWECAVRAARGQTVTATVQGWTGAADGALWRVGQTVSVQPGLTATASEWLIVGADYSLDDQGTLAVLELMPPAAYTPRPIVTPREETAA